MQANHLGVASILAALIAIIAVQGGQQPIVALSLALGAFGAAIGVLGSSAPAVAAPAPAAKKANKSAAKKQQQKAKKAKQPKKQRKPEPEPEPEPEPIAAPSKKKKKKKAAPAAPAAATSKKSSKKSSSKKEEQPLSKKAKKAAAAAAAVAAAAAAVPELTKAQKRRKAKKQAAAEADALTGLQAQHTSVSTSEDGWEQVRSRRKPKVAGAKKENKSSDEPGTPAGESLQLEIPNRFYGALIGSGGSTLNLIQEACDVRINIPRKGEGEVVTITGSSEGIARCKGTIESLVKTGFSSITHPGQLRNEIAVEENLRPRLVGKGACNLKALQAATNTSINLPQQGKGNKVSIVGAPDDIRQCKELIRQLLTDGYCSATHPGHVKLEMSFPSNMFGTLIGTGGATIKHIQNSTGVMLNIPRSTDINQNLVLVGTSESIGAAQKHISAILEKEQAEADAAKAANEDEEEYWKVDESNLDVW